MKREVTRQLELAEAAATKARALAESLTARDADTGGPLVIDRAYFRQSISPLCVAVAMSVSV